MAKPFGATQSSYFGYDIATTASDPYYLYVAFPMPTMPDHWCNKTTARSYKIKIRSMVNVPAGETVTIAWHLGCYGNRYEPITLEQEYDGDVIADGWQTADTSDDYLKGFYIREYSFVKNWRNWPRYISGYADLYSDLGNSWQLDGVYMEIVTDQAYTAPSPTGELDAIYIDRDTAANRIYAANRAATSFHAMEVLAHTYNSLAFNNKFCLSIPCFYDGS